MEMTAAWLEGGIKMTSNIHGHRLCMPQSARRWSRCIRRNPEGHTRYKMMWEFALHMLHDCRFYIEGKSAGVHNRQRQVD